MKDKKNFFEWNNTKKLKFSILCLGFNLVVNILNKLKASKIIDQNLIKVGKVMGIHFWDFFLRCILFLILNFKFYNKIP